MVGNETSSTLTNMALREFPQWCFNTAFLLLFPGLFQLPSLLLASLLWSLEHPLDPEPSLETLVPLPH